MTRPPPSLSSLAGAKAALRLKMRPVVAAVPPDTIAAESRAVTQALLRMPEYEAAQAVSVYINMPSGEVATGPIIEALFAAGKACFVPRWGSGGAGMDMVRLRDPADFAGLPLNAWKIPEPVRDEAREVALAPGSPRLDLILLPGLAFDAKRNRLGHGKGYYDSYLARVRDAQPGAMPPTVALALTAQVLPAGESVPVEPTDVKPDFVLTANRVIS